MQQDQPNLADAIQVTVARSSHDRVHYYIAKCRLDGKPVPTIREVITMAVERYLDQEGAPLATKVEAEPASAA